MNLFKDAYQQLKGNKFSTVISIVVFIVVMSTLLSALLCYKAYEHREVETFAGINIPVIVSFGNENSVPDEVQRNWDEIYEEIRNLEMVVQSENYMGLLIDTPEYKRVVDDQYISIGFMEEFPNYGDATGDAISLDQSLLESSEFPVIISSEFAELNELNINDIITLDYTKDIVGYEKTNVEIDSLREVEYTIVGINNFQPNELVMPITSSQTISRVIRDNGYTTKDVFTVTQTLYLDEFSDMEEFESQAGQIVGSDLTVYIDYDLVDISSEAREALSGYESASLNLMFAISLIFLIFQIFILFIVSIITTIISRDRYKQQIALGATRNKIILQLLCEKFIKVGIASPFAIIIALIYNSYNFGSQALSIVMIQFIVVRLISAVVLMVLILLVTLLVPIVYIYSVNVSGFDK